MGKHLNLLALPAEIRLAIYDSVIHLKTDLLPAHNTKARKETTLLFTTLYLAPWCNFMLACREIAVELRDHMMKHVNGNQSVHNTWILELKGERGNTWFKPSHCILPCPPVNLKALRVEVPLHTGYPPWATALALDSIISRMVRSGPSLDMHKPWKVPMRVNELELSFTWVYRKVATASLCGLPERIVTQFRAIQRRSSNDGHPLRAAVDNIKLITNDYEQSWSTLGEDD